MRGKIRYERHANRFQAEKSIFSLLHSNNSINNKFFCFVTLLLHTLKKDFFTKTKANGKHFHK